MERILKNSRAGLVGIAVLAVLVIRSSAEPVSISCRRQEVFEAGDSTRVIHLSHRLVITESDSVSVAERRLANGQDYRMDYAQGIVYLLRAPSPGDSVCIRYAHLPADLKPSYCLRAVGRNTRLDADFSDRKEPRAERPRSYDIKASGSKTISVETGTFKDLRVNQSLNLSLGGAVSENVEVRGVLSDRDVSFSNVGSTTRLKDLDRIFMEVRSPNAYARVGDLEINESPGDLLTLKRNMTGFLGNAAYGSKEFVASGAASRTRYETVEIRGRESISGPYVVSGPDGERADVVKHTEKVWLEGREMARGNEADYVIDYALSEIYFNPRHMIRDDARIIVDYESRRNDDRRQFYYAHSNLDIGSGTSVAVSFVNEGYSATGSETLPADSAPQQILGSGGGDWVDGGRFVGAGKGRYASVELDTLSYYEYVGEGLGDYEVAFTRVGAEEGRYSYIYSEEFDTYIHAFTGLGDYTDMVKALPRIKSQVVHLSASAQPVPWLELTSEAAQSEGHCRHPGDIWKMETDRAYVVGLNAVRRLPSLGGISLGSIDIDAGRRSVGPNYIGFDRLRKPDFLEVWAQEPLDGFEKSNHLGLTHSVGEKIKTTFEVGSLETGAGDSRRYRAGVNLGDGRLGITASTQVARMAVGGLTRGSEKSGIAVRVPLAPVLLSVGHTYELRAKLRDSTSTRRAEYYSRADLTGEYGGVHLGFSTTSEERDQGTGWMDYSSVVEGKLEFDAKLGKTLAFRAGISQRRIDYSSHAGLSDNRATGADLHLNIRDLSVISSMSIDYRLANTLSTLYATRLVKVESGDYDSLGNYRPESGGYVLSRYETGMQPVTRVKAGFLLELGRKGKIILNRSLSSRTVVDVEGEGAGGRIEKVALLQPGYLLTSQDVVYGLIDIRQEVVMRRNRALTVSVGVRGSRLLDGRCSERREQRSSFEVSGRISSSGFKGMSARLEGKTAKTNSEWRTDTGQGSPSRRTWSARLDLERSIGPSFESRMKFELSDEDRTEPRSHTLEARLGPGFTLFAGPVRCDTNLGARRILRSDNEVDTVEPRRDSVDWNSRINTRHGRHTSLSVEYSGRKYRDLPAVHSVRASLSAAF